MIVFIIFCNVSNQAQHKRKRFIGKLYLFEVKIYYTMQSNNPSLFTWTRICCACCRICCVAFQIRTRIAAIEFSFQTRSCSCLSSITTTSYGASRPIRPIFPFGIDVGRVYEIIGNIIKFVQYLFSLTCRILLLSHFMAYLPGNSQFPTPKMSYPARICIPPYSRYHCHSLPHFAHI